MPSNRPEEEQDDEDQEDKKPKQDFEDYETNWFLGLDINWADVVLGKVDLEKTLTSQKRKFVGIPLSLSYSVFAALYHEHGRRARASQVSFVLCTALSGQQQAFLTDTLALFSWPVPVCATAVLAGLERRRR